MKTAKDRIIVALDVADIAEAEDIVRRLDMINIFKIGQILFSAEGTKTIDLLKDYKKEIFLDLKYHDIPHILYEVGKIITAREVFMVSVHCLGGWEMLDAIITSVNRHSEEFNKRRPLIIGVSILTSITQEILEDDIGIKGELTEHVLRLARLGKRIGLDGVTASPQEVPILGELKKDNPNFLLITPGVRLPIDDDDTITISNNDHKRVGTPAGAVLAGADYIVIGRPILRAPNLIQTINKIISQICSVLNSPE